MAKRHSDTVPEVEAVRIEGLREMPVWRKVELMGAMHRTVRSLLLAGLARSYPGDTPLQLRRRLADRILGPELAARVYGPLQE